MTQIDSIRTAIARSLDWEDAHARFERAVAEIPLELQGDVPPGLPYSAWQLLEHVRITQRDILEFCRNPSYQELHWPDDYWPKGPKPPSREAWSQSVAAYRQDLRELQALATDPEVDLLAKVPAGTGQTYLRELLLILDHTAYHLGELVVVRRVLGAWPATQ